MGGAKDIGVKISTGLGGGGLKGWKYKEKGWLGGFRRGFPASQRGGPTQKKQ